MAINSQTEVVVRAVRRMISEGALRPGDRLPVEKELAHELQVSRGSLREGIRALAALGIVETRQGAGTFITALEPGALLDPMAFWVSLQAGPDATHAHVVRRALEVESVQQAARSFGPDDVAAAEQILARAEQAISADPTDHNGALEADLEFHRLIAERAQNPVLAALIETLSAPTLRHRLWRSLHRAGRLEETHRQHRAILAALAAGDVPRARAWMETHLYAVETDVSDASGDEPLGGGGDPLVGAGERDPDERG